MTRTTRSEPREASRIRDPKQLRAVFEAYGKRELSPALKVSLAFATLKSAGMEF